MAILYLRLHFFSLSPFHSLWIVSVSGPWCPVSLQLWYLIIVTSDAVISISFLFRYILWNIYIRLLRLRCIVQKAGIIYRWIKTLWMNPLSSISDSLLLDKLFGWGTNKIASRVIYIGYIRSVLDYECVEFGSAADTIAKNLNPIQFQALWLYRSI